MSRIGKFVETEHRFVVARDQGKGEWRVTLKRHGVIMFGNAILVMVT